MTDSPKMQRTAAPLSVRFSEPERQQLRKLAGAKPLGLYIRERALEGYAEPRRARRTPVRDRDALGRLLGLLGQSRLASNLNQLAKAAHLGSLPVTAETEADLRAACGEVREMRQLLLYALGVQTQPDVTKNLSITPVFTAGAGGVPV